MDLEFFYSVFQCECSPIWHFMRIWGFNGCSSLFMHVCVGALISVVFVQWLTPTWKGAKRASARQSQNCLLLHLLSYTTQGTGEEGV